LTLTSIHTAAALMLAALLTGCAPTPQPAPKPPPTTTPSTTARPSLQAHADPGEEDAYTRHIKALQARAPKGFTIVEAKPFVVLGDEAPWDVRARARTTVLWASQRLKAQYFDRDPKRIVDIWLFKDKISYMNHTRALWGEEPTTPYGYYTAKHNALVMNIATGGGTLVHEMVHPFMATNFPACPSWFNEGLASLYEQCGDKDGRIYGYTNWRLAGLQEAIRARRLPRFKELMSTTEHGFYYEDPGTHYAQARYLCYYLQEKGLLQRYYRDFVANHTTDPTGYATLQQVLGEPDMEQFQRDWEAWILTLHYP
ncbi:MAG: hypothetical protein AAFX99_28625, partial [Myxococcota bacterium]